MGERMAAYGGSLTLEDRGPPGGCVLKATLPLPPVIGVGPHPDQGRSGMKILVVDDHVVVREGVRRLLVAIEGAEILEAETSHEALALFRQALPQIVVLDINLKSSSGMELLRRFRIENPASQIVIFSMYSDVAYATSARRAGAVGYVSKSAPAAELLTAVRRAARGEAYVDSETARELASAAFSPEESAQGSKPAGDRYSAAAGRGQEPFRDRRDFGDCLQDGGQHLQPPQGETGTRADRRPHSPGHRESHPQNRTGEFVAVTATCKIHQYGGSQEVVELLHKPRDRVCNGLHSGAGWSSPVARQAHNLKVVGSNPAPATIH